MLFFDLFSVATPSPGSGLMVVFFGLFLLLFDLFSVGAPGKFSADALERSVCFI